MAAYLFSIIWPVALHMILSDFSVIILTVATGQTPNSALCTTLTAILVIPPALWMYRGDGKPAANRLKSVAEQDTKKELDEKENGGPTLTWHIFMGIACFVSGGILDRVWSRVLLWLRVQDYFSNQTQEQLLASQLAVQIIGLGILVPVAEELIFRGLLYARIRRTLPVWASVLTASVIFALYHGNMIQILFAFPMAIILTLLYEKGKWISYPILFHMGVNLTTVVLGALAG